jgi:hypothetical protein
MNILSSDGLVPVRQAYQLRSLARQSELSQGPSACELGPPLNIGQVARLIGCSPWTVRQTLIPRGLPHFRFRTLGRLIFYQEQVVRWIEKKQRMG